MPGSQPFWDPLNEYEPHNTIYTLEVCVPDKVPGKIRQWIHGKTHPTQYAIRDRPVDYREGDSSETQPILCEKPSNVLREYDLQDMKTKTIKLKAYEFPLDFRCVHIQIGCQRSCDHGCYLLERGGEGHDHKCAAEKCEGHRWNGTHTSDDKGAWCFGRKGERLVYIREHDSAVTNMFELGS